MKIIMIDRDTSVKLEKLSLMRNQSKGVIALQIVEKIFGQGVPHPLPCAKREGDIFFRRGGAHHAH